MRHVTPKVFLIAQTVVDNEMRSFLRHLGAPDWTTDAKSDGEELIEVAGRMCYKSFDVGLNANLTKVRHGNKEYIANVLAQKHGSVLEHSSVTFALCDVSRVVTHELVRHRAGTAFSQESLRFVRLTDIKAYIPKAFSEHPRGDEIVDLFNHTVTHLEGIQRQLAELTDIDGDGASFGLKKFLTSAFRRLAPIGLATNIIVTANHRAWRHMIAMRTDASAEEEIRIVFQDIASRLKDAFPALYQDMHEQEDGSWKFDNWKA
jgi:thymidylate synthase (FAD)